MGDKVFGKDRFESVLIFPKRSRWADKKAWNGATRFNFYQIQTSYIAVLGIFLKFWPWKTEEPHSFREISLKTLQ